MSTVQQKPPTSKSTEYPFEAAYCVHCDMRLGNELSVRWGPNHRVHLVCVGGALARLAARAALQEADDSQRLAAEAAEREEDAAWDAKIGGAS